MAHEQEPPPLPRPHEPAAREAAPPATRTLKPSFQEPPRTMRTLEPAGQELPQRKMIVEPAARVAAPPTTTTLEPAGEELPLSTMILKAAARGAAPPKTGTLEPAARAAAPPTTWALEPAGQEPSPTMKTLELVTQEAEAPSPRPLKPAAREAQEPPSTMILKAAARGAAPPTTRTLKPAFQEPLRSTGTLEPPGQEPSPTMKTLELVTQEAEAPSPRPLKPAAQEEEEPDPEREESDDAAVGDTTAEVARCLPPTILELIIRRLPATVPVASYSWLNILLSLPRPALLLPGHLNDQWMLLFPSRLAPRGEILTEWRLDANQVLKHSTMTTTCNLGIPSSNDTPRLVDGHPGHPIFVQGQTCIVCSVVHSRVYLHQLLIPGIREEEIIILRGAISYSFLSPEPQEPADAAMLLLATDSYMFGRPVRDNRSAWAVGSLRGIVHGRVTDILFADAAWYIMDTTRHLYRVSFSELSL